VAKTPLTLNRHTEKYEEKAAITLFDLSSEPVASSGEPDEKKCKNSNRESATSFLNQ